MQEHKHKVSVLEEDVSSAKSLYSTALRSLEAISDEIHRQRLERRQQQQLGVRGAGVGAECPLPPPSWEKGLSIDGRDALHTGNCQGLDPLGVLKVSSTISYGGASVSRQRSRNLSGESCHGNEIVEEESLHRAKEPPAVIGVSSQDNVVDIDAAAPKEQTPVAGGSEEGQQDGGGSGSGSGSGSSPRDKQGVLIPGDPLGVLPPTYTSLSDTRLASPSRSSGGASISHPAFTGSLPPRSASHTSNVAHPLVTRAGASHVKASAVSRSKSATSTPEAFVPPSVVYANPEEARRPSYRRAVEASQRDAEEFELPENLDAPELDEVYMSLPCAEGRSRSVHEVVVESRQRSYSNPAQPSDLKARSPPRAIPSRISSAVQEALADGRRHSSAPERSATLTSYTQHALSEHGSQEGSPVNGSPSSARRTHKLQGLILRIDPTMDPLRDFEPRVRSQTAPPAPSQGNPSVTSPPAAAASQPEPHTPTPTPTPTQSAPNLPGKKAQDEGESAADSKADCSVSKPIIRSASTISTAGSERSETEFSEVESVSATQSPTKPRSRLLHVPASGECVEDSSDTESLASTGPMLDDEQVEFLTMDFSDASISQEREDYSSATLPSHLTRNSWSRMSLPPRLSYLEGFISRAKRLSGDFDSVPDFPESPTEEEAEEGSLSENIKGFMGSEHLGSSYKEGCSSQARSLPREFDASAPPSMVESPTEQDEGEISAAGEPKGLCKNGDQFQSGHNEDHTRDQDKETECGEVLKDNGAETKVESFVVRLWLLFPDQREERFVNGKYTGQIDLPLLWKGGVKLKGRNTYIWDFFSVVKWETRLCPLCLVVLKGEVALIKFHVLCAGVIVIVLKLNLLHTAR